MDGDSCSIDSDGAEFRRNSGQNFDGNVDVVVYSNVPDGTILSNQAFVSAVDDNLADLPSDDPRTDVPDDPTRDVVGNFPLLFAEKSAVLQVDNGSPGVVDPLDVLRYTITVYNNGSVPATMVELFDNVPADVTYVADTTTLNGLPVGQPDGRNGQRQRDRLWGRQRRRALRFRMRRPALHWRGDGLRPPDGRPWPRRHRLPGCL